MRCFYCDNDIKDDDLKFMLALEKPYINLFFHRECYKVNVKPQEELYLAQNVEKMIYLLNNDIKRSKNR